MLALATEAIFCSVAGSITSKRAPSEDFFHLPPIQRSVGTLARRLSYAAINSSTRPWTPTPTPLSGGGRTRRTFQPHREGRTCREVILPLKGGGVWWGSLFQLF